MNADKTKSVKRVSDGSRITLQGKPTSDGKPFSICVVLRLSAVQLRNFGAALAVPRRRAATQRLKRGATLIECLVYISVLSVILSVAGVAYSRVLDHTYQLRRAAADIARALDAGERWRADVRRTTAAPRLVQEGAIQALHLPHRDLEVVYFFDGSNVLRRAGTDTTWLPFLRNVKATRFVEEPRQHVKSWRWEVELATGRRPVRVRPLFTFTAVAPTSTAP